MEDDHPLSAAAARSLVLKEVGREGGRERRGGEIAAVRLKLASFSLLQDLTALRSSLPSPSGRRRSRGGRTVELDLALWRAPSLEPPGDFSSCGRGAGKEGGEGKRGGRMMNRRIIESTHNSSSLPPSSPPSLLSRFYRTFPSRSDGATSQATPRR